MQDYLAVLQNDPMAAEVMSLRLWGSAGVVMMAQIILTYLYIFVIKTMPKSKPKKEKTHSKIRIQYSKCPVHITRDCHGSQLFEDVLCKRCA